MSATLVVTSTFPQYPEDPRGAFLRTHWEAAAARKESVTVLAPRTAWCRGDLGGRCEVQRFSYAPRWCSTLTGRHGILGNVRERPWRALWMPMLLWAARSALRQQLVARRPDRVVAHMLLPFGVVVARECSRQQVPFEIYAHGTDVDVFTRIPAGLRRNMERDLRNAGVVFVPSLRKARILRPLLGGTPVRVEPMVHCVPDLADPGQPCEVDVLFLGRLIAQKGVDTLLYALARMPPVGRVVVAGDGPQRRRLEALARRLELPVEFPGFVEGEARDRLLRGARVVAVPSRRTRFGLSEGAPLVVREALAAGAFVVGSDEGGIPDLLRDAVAAGRGRVVAADDVDAWAQALRQLAVAA